MSLQEDAKKILPFVQAMADGKTVEYNYVQSIAGNANWFEKRDLQFYSETKYRIKPEKKWRPYTRDEWERVVRVRCKEHGHSYPVQRIETDVLFIYGTSYTFAGAMKYFTNLDGTPCGVEVEDA